MWQQSTMRRHRRVIAPKFTALAFVSGWCLVKGYSPAFETALSRAADAHECPTCDTLFTKVRVSKDGKRVQDIVLQERGEPKSGTTFMCTWARTALRLTCEYLRLTFGENTCSIGQDDGALTFEPSLGADSAKCPCQNVDLVRIEVTPAEKHTLPVASAGGACPLNHRGGLARNDDPCRYDGGPAVENFGDLWSCMLESDCYITDDRPQFVIMRDPRAAAVSAYFHMKLYSEKDPLLDMTVDDAVMKLLPAICQWVTIRHLLFEGIMSKQSTVFWYQDAMDDPLLWHYRLTVALGLQLPSTWVESISEVSSHHSVLNEHVGGEAADGERTWQDEISPELVDEMNAVMETWLPPVILARLGLITSFARA